MKKETLLQKKAHHPPSSSRSVSGSGLRYGLLILIDLAQSYDQSGYPITLISKKHCLTPSELEPIISRLETNGLIGRNSEDVECLFLKERPDSQWIFRIVPILKSIWN